MADIQRNDSLAIVFENKDLLKDHKNIQLAEKENQIKGLELQMERMKTVEMKQIELRIKTLKIERENLIRDITALDKTNTTVLEQ